MGETVKKGTEEQAMNIQKWYCRLTAGAAVLLALIMQVNSGGAQTVMTLDKAVETAMKNSPTMQHQYMNLQQSHENLNAQDAALKANFSLTINPYGLSQKRAFDTPTSNWYTTRSTTSSENFTITQPIRQTDGTFTITDGLNWQKSFSEIARVKTNSSFNNNLSLNFSQPLFTYNRTELSLKSLAYSIENTSISYALQKMSIQRQVTQNFYSLYQSIQSLQIAQESMKNTELSYEIIKGQVDAGLQPLDQLLQQEVSLASAKASLENRQVSLQNSFESFNQLIGLPIDQQLVIQADISYQPVDVDVDKAVEYALKYRFEIRQRQISIEQAENSIITTSAQNEFKGSLSLSLGIQGQDKTFMNLYDTPVQNRSVGLSFTIPLYDWGERDSRIKSAQISLKSSQMNADENKTDITLSVRSAVRSLKNTSTQIEIAQQNVQNAQRTYDINFERYKNGDITSLTLSQYQDQLTSAKTSVISNQISYLNGLLNLQTLCLWDFAKNQAVVPDLGKDVLYGTSGSLIKLLPKATVSQ
jgi:outer membrane protein